MSMAETGPLPVGLPLHNQIIQKKRLLQISICPWWCLLQTHPGHGTSPPSALPVFRVWGDTSCSREAKSLRGNGVKESTRNQGLIMSQCPSVSRALLQHEPRATRWSGASRLQSAARERPLNHSFPAGRGRRGGFHRLY